MVIVFDMDETLFDELSFVRCGLSTVANFMQAKWGIDAAESYPYMLERLKESRSHIIDGTLAHFGLNTTRNLRLCISAYRLCDPTISLYPDAQACLERFKGYPLYLVTDGNKTVQTRKIRALGLDKILKRCFVSYQYGRDKSKPSPYCFQRIAVLEKTEPSRVWYVGDNPAKDFIGIKPLGFRTVRLLRGQHKDVRPGRDYEADIEINSLDELTPELLENFSPESHLCLK